MCLPGLATQKLLWTLPALQDVSLQVILKLLSCAAVAHCWQKSIFHSKA